jgi:hypothetical protein
MITVFFMLGWDGYGFNKNRAGTRYPELMFSHPVGCAGHVVDFGTSEARNVMALFFILGWDRYGFNKKRAGTHYAELMFSHPVRYAGQVVRSGASGA